MRTKIFNPIIATAKALAIILMVIGHSGCPEFMAHFIYLFHIPVFSFVVDISMPPH